MMRRTSSWLPAKKNSFPGLCAFNPRRAAYKLRVSQPGQPAINAATRCCAVYGFPIRHSASPAMHNAAFAALGLNWRYLAFEVRPDDLRAAIAGAKAMQFSGLNLTVPHKLLAMQIVDELDESAKTWGAVNTVRFEARTPMAGNGSRCISFSETQKPPFRRSPVAGFQHRFRRGRPFVA
jgi:hypothetical protein